MAIQEQQSSLHDWWPYIEAAWGPHSKDQNTSENTTWHPPPSPLTWHVDKFWGTQERAYISTPGIGCQHGDGYQRCQNFESKILHAGHLAPIRHTNHHSTHATTPPSPNNPCHHSDSSPQHPCTTCHTRITLTPQSLSQDSLFAATHLPQIINPVTPPHLK